MPKSTSLLADIEGTSNEHKAGAAMFASIEQVFELQTMMRFSDPVLIEILRKMRTPGGSTLTDTEWKRLKKTNVDESTMDEGQIHQIMMKTTDWYHSCYLWSIVNLTAYTSAKLTAKKIAPHAVLFTGGRQAQSNTKTCCTRSRDRRTSSSDSGVLRKAATNQ